MFFVDRENRYNAGFYAEKLGEIIDRARREGLKVGVDDKGTLYVQNTAKYVDELNEKEDNSFFVAKVAPMVTEDPS